jgi:hypothetical protein
MLCLNIAHAAVVVTIGTAAHSIARAVRYHASLSETDIQYCVQLTCHRAALRYLSSACMTR